MWFVTQKGYMGGFIVQKAFHGVCLGPSSDGHSVECLAFSNFIAQMGLCDISLLGRNTLGSNLMRSVANRLDMILLSDG